jgi:uncharacterized protein YdbL (DUF1318 family)
MNLKINERPLRLILIPAFALIAGSLMASPAFAQTLQDLRASGAVCEQADGYARAVQPGAKPVVNNTNGKRRDIYKSEATKMGTSVKQVGRIFSGRLQGKYPGTACP